MLTAMNYVIGLDYGTDSCRAVLADAANGEIAAVAVMAYPRWAKGLYCDPAASRYRQHPSDYLETMQRSILELGEKAGAPAMARVCAIAIDTTASTPCAADAQGTPLALHPEFQDNPDAMFVLWKDHTAIAEAERINKLSRTWGGTDFTRYEGGIYSSEWFWSKILHVLGADSAVAAAAVTFVEHCDWMPALLCGVSDPRAIRRSRCAMGHKAMWHKDFGGYPDDAFLARLDPRLPGIKATLGTETYTSDQSAGSLSPWWADTLGLPSGIPVCVGSIDAHVGGLGGGAREGWMVKVVGTSTCDMIVAPADRIPAEPVRGICGQVDGSIVPGMVGFEAGQSAFGDVYAWLKDLLLWPARTLLPDVPGLSGVEAERIAAAMAEQLIPALSEAAANVNPEESGLIALDWLNGRRTPDADQTLKGAVAGLTLATDAPRLFRAFVEATAFGSRAIVERFRAEGVAIEGIVAVGGVARKSPLVMQILADVLGAPIQVPDSDQSVALGAAMLAAVAAGLYPDVAAAQGAMLAPIERVYAPDPARVAAYDRLYAEYRRLGEFAEGNRALSSATL